MAGPIASRFTAAAMSSNACGADLFNNTLWPDFLALSEGKDKFLCLAPLEAGQTRSLEGLQITAIAINHVVPTVAYIVSDERAAVAFVSDTGPTDEIWQRLNALPRVDAVFLECCFPDSLAWLAERVEAPDARAAGRRGPQADTADSDHRGPYQGAVPRPDHRGVAGAEIAGTGDRRVWEAV